MRYILTAVLIALSTFSYSQSLSLKTLLSYNDKSFDDFETIFISKNWRVVEQSNDNEMLSLKKFVKSVGDNTFFIAKTEYANGNKMIYYSTTIATEYLKLKQDLKSLGFTFTGSEKDFDGVVMSVYKKNDVELKLLSHKLGDLDQNAYNVSIYKYTNQ
jgi:hypothetical protein